MHESRWLVTNDPFPYSAPNLRGKEVVMGLNAAIVTVIGDLPQILVVPHGPDDEAQGNSASWGSLPFGPFDPVHHRTMEMGLRAWVREQTNLSLGYVEQLYTFGDRGRQHSEAASDAAHFVSIGYLALTRQATEELDGAKWEPWYQYFPWEDWQAGPPALIDKVIAPRLSAWAARESEASSDELTRGKRIDRLRLAFGVKDGVLDPDLWDEDKVLERYELLYEAGLLREAVRDGRTDEMCDADVKKLQLGRPMHYDHRRILATAMGRLRAKLKYRPVVFELMPPSFTLYELQRVVENVMGQHVHKQHFRRLVERAGFVEPTGRLSTATGGRPAELFRFRREIFNERPAPGLKLAPSRSRVGR
jgi:hypothetical protein